MIPLNSYRNEEITPITVEKIPLTVGNLVKWRFINSWRKWSSGGPVRRPSPAPRQALSTSALSGIAGAHGPTATASAGVAWSSWFIDSSSRRRISRVRHNPSFLLCVPVWQAV